MSADITIATGVGFNYSHSLGCAGTNVNKNKQTRAFSFQNMYLISPEPVISPVQGCKRSCCGSQADLPDGIHSICGMTFCNTGARGHRVTVQTAGRVLRCGWPHWDKAAE